MRLDEVLRHLDAANRLLSGGDPQSLEQSEIHVKSALESLATAANEPAMDLDALRRAHAGCRRVTGLLAAAQEFYMGLAGMMSVQAMGYGSAATKPQAGAGRRFVLNA